MFAAERNELLTRVGGGTPVGELFRRYWLPVLLGEELPEPDCPPVRVKLLGECLIAFRDTKGRLGLIEEFCAHRGVSLWFGRNEENGIDRKSTRLNSSHSQISYAVFCLKKKKTKNRIKRQLENSSSQLLIDI